MGTEIANLDTGELVDYTPMHPLEIEHLIVEIGHRLERSVPALRDLWQARYAAERALISAKANSIINSKLESVTEKRAEADLVTMGLRQDFDAAKETLHAAEELQKALQARLFGMQNINRVQAALYNAGPVR